MRHVPEIQIPEGEWRRIGHPDARSRLLTTIAINGVDLHVEAVEVMVGPDGQQASQDDGLETVEAAYTLDPDGSFLTMELGGRNYVVVAYPFK